MTSIDLPALDRPYDGLQVLPRELWLPALVTSAGRDTARLRDLPRWLAALDAGELPAATADFADPAALAPLRREIAELGLPGLCKGVRSMALQVLRSLLWHLDRIVDDQPRCSRSQAIANAAARYREDWLLDKADWEQALALLQGLGDLSTLRWDQLRGHLKSREWQEAQRISALLPELKSLAELIRRLGRAERRQAAPTRPQLDLVGRSQTQRQPVRWRETRLPDAPGELRGIRLTSRFDQMLASEAAQIRHPVFRKLFRARLAEGRLLGYDTEAVLLDAIADPQARNTPRELESTPERRHRGPMIVCIDTSGSMQGAPENIAKAAVLATMGVAHDEQRACLLIAFGGPGEIVEHTLDLSPTGLQAMLAVMGQSFDGGTDLQTPIERAIEAVERGQWRQADLLIVSDGEFGCTDATLSRLDRVRDELGLRVQGILVGDRETMGLMEVCDDIHWLRDWRRHASDAKGRNDGFVPVHTASLTALYFPNALSERAARHKR